MLITSQYDTGVLVPFHHFLLSAPCAYARSRKHTGMKINICTNMVQIFFQDTAAISFHSIFTIEVFRNLHLQFADIEIPQNDENEIL